MITWLGVTAGKIWECLDREGGVALSELHEKLGEPEEVILMSVGWLVREGHVVLTQDEGSHKVFLRKQDGIG